MGINEMEFQWRLNWWYRPTQCDGFGTSVTDYCESFCDWKDSMAINSCPAVETDYVDAFIQNLRCDIRSRLESKGRPRTRRLSDAFYDAKLEECLISMEEVFKKFEAKLEAPNLFDKMPSQVPADSQDLLVSSSSLPVSSEDSCSNELAETSSDDVVIETEEFSGLEDDESLQIDLEKKTHKLFDDLNEPILDQVLGNVGYDSQVGTSNQEFGNSEAHYLALEALSWLFEEDEKSIPSKLEDMRNAQKLLDESPTKHLQGQTEKKGEGCCWIQELHGCELLGNEVGQPHFLLERVEQINGSDIHEKLMLAVSFPSNFDLKYDATKVVAVRSSKLMFNVMAVFMFDPGGSFWNCKGCEFSTSIAAHNHELDVDLCVSKVLLLTFDPGGEMLSNLVVFMWIGKVLMVVFDPGGSWYCMRYLHFQLNGELSFPEKRLNSQVAQQLLERMPSTMLSIVCWLGLVEYAVNTREVSLITISTKFNLEKFLPTIVNQLVDICLDFKFEDYWFCEMPPIVLIDINGLKQGGRLYGVYNGMLIHLVALANKNHNIQISVLCKMLQSGPNSCTSVFLLAGGMTNLIPSDNMTLNQDENMTLVQDEILNGVSAYDNVYKEFLASTSVDAFRSMGFDCRDKFVAESLVLMTMQTWAFPIFVWDPGLCAIISYILMDKAGFEMHYRATNKQGGLNQALYFVYLNGFCWFYNGCENSDQSVSVHPWGQGWF